MNKTTQRPPWAHPVWGGFFSLRVGLVLLALLTVASMIGTAYAPIERAQRVVFYTWWYQLLLLALAINITCASVKTVLTRALPAGRPRFMRGAEQYARTQPNATRPFRGAVEDLAAALRSRGFRVTTAGPCGHADRGMWSHWGSVVSHLGLVAVLVSAFLAAWVAREGQITIPEGRKSGFMLPAGDEPRPVALGFELECEDFETHFFPQTRMPAMFRSTVRVHEPGRPLWGGDVEVNKSLFVNGWNLHQTSYEEDPDARRYALKVAGGELPEPVTVELSPGQTRWADRARGLALQLTADSRPAWRVLHEMQVVQGGELSGTGLSIRADRFEPDFAIALQGERRVITSRSDQPNNPALRVTVLSGVREPFSQWLFLREDMKAAAHMMARGFRMDLREVDTEGAVPRFVVHAWPPAAGDEPVVFELALGESAEADAGPSAAEETAARPAAPADGPYRVELVETRPAYVTTLTLTSNPLIPVVYAACAVMVLGLVIAFGIERREIRFFVDEPAGVLHVAGAYKHPREALDRATQAAIEEAAAAQPTPALQEARSA